MSERLFKEQGCSPQHIEELKRELEKVTASNQQKGHMLQQKHQIEMSIPPRVRMELFYDYLGEIGVLTEEQRLNFELKWQNMLATDLAQMESEVEAKLAQQRAQQIFQPQQEKKIILPGSPGFRG